MCICVCVRCWYECVYVCVCSVCAQCVFSVYMRLCEMVVCVCMCVLSVYAQCVYMRVCEMMVYVCVCV